MERLVPLALLLAARCAAAGFLYDPASGQLPHDYAPNPWSYGQVPDTFVPTSAVTAPVTATLADGLLVLDTSGGNDRAGWATTSSTLDRADGFQVRFQLRIDHEHHAADNDRAGFSVTAISSDLLGIELAFWQSEIWAQNAGFTHGEGNTGGGANLPLQTGATLFQYDLRVKGDRYRLDSNGVEVLSGALRDYSASGVPYTVPNLLFLGDNTLSARSTATIGRVELVQGLAAVPEPGEWAGAAAAALLGAAALRRIRRRD